jgi:hypothetical protein
MDCPDIAPQLGLVDALLQAENVSLDFLPGYRFPNFTRFLDRCHKL